MAVDVVHEGVRWFGAGLRVPVTVTEPPPPRFPPLREARRRRRRRAALLFPRIVHRVWLGDGPMSARNEQFGVAFTDLHPGWEMRLWGDDHLPELGITAADRAAARSASELSNIVRYELLRRFGGVYIDTDVECRRSLEPLLGGVHACAAFETPGVTGTAFLGSVPGHPIFERTALEGRRTLGLGAHSADANGPHFLKLVAEQEGGLTVFGSQLFYPVLWDARERAVESFPGAYAVHHWDMSWVPQE
jgi:mannosyltransferase OCH1-like enzyme